MSETAPMDLPCIRFGPHRVSRLILGANPINGGSHLSRFVNQQTMGTSYDEALLYGRASAGAAAALPGVGYQRRWVHRTWQSGPGHNLDLYRRFREQGGQMHYISLAADSPDPIEQRR